MSVETAVPRKISLEEFFEMDFPQDGVKRELVNGEIVMTPAANMPHKDIQIYLHECFTLFKLKHRQYKAYSEFNLQLWKGHHAIPDFAIARTTEQGGPCRVTKLFLIGPPDVVVEVQSPGGTWRDLVDKRREYEQGGVPEYWIFDPEERQALFLRLQEGRYREIPVPPNRIYECESVPGLKLDVAALFRNDLDAGLAAMGL